MAKAIDYQGEDQKRAQKLIDIKEEDIIATEFPCQSIAKTMEVLSQTFLTAEERKKFQNSYEPDPDSFNAYIDYMIGRPGQKATYEGYKKFKKERERSK